MLLPKSSLEIKILICSTPLNHIQFAFPNPTLEWGIASGWGTTSFRPKPQKSTKSQWYPSIWTILYVPEFRVRAMDQKWFPPLLASFFARFFRPRSRSPPLNLPVCPQPENVNTAHRGSGLFVLHPQLALFGPNPAAMMGFRNSKWMRFGGVEQTKILFSKLFRLRRRLK